MPIWVIYGLPLVKFGEQFFLNLSSLFLCQNILNYFVYPQRIIELLVNLFLQLVHLFIP